MRRIAIIIVALILAIAGVVTAIFLIKGNDEGPEVVEGAIYSKGSTLGFLDSEYSGGYASTFSNALALKTNVKMAEEDGTPYENEIVVGMSNRPVAIEAYRRLADLYLSDEIADDEENYVKWLIYTDGKSIAIAFEENDDYIGVRAAIDYCVKNLVVDALVLEPGVVHKDAANIFEFYSAEDEILREAQWGVIASSFENGEEIVSALKDLYTIYSDDLIVWMANLYEPEICQCIADVCAGGASCGTGGFYYSNSARNTKGYLPDVESTQQILSFLENSGMTVDYTKSLPDEILDQIGRFVISLQDESGYFYHPQWGDGVSTSRKGRDLMRSESILQRLGLQPIYDTPNGVKGSGVKLAAALTARLSRSFAVGASEAILTASNTDANLADEESFRNYLNTLDVKNNSYAAGNTLASYFNTIRSRNYELQREGADYDLIEILIEHLNDAQNKETGTWYYVSESDPSYSEYYAVNGVMKISCVYEAAQVMMPNSDKALRAAMDAISSDEEVGACVDIYNTWFTISNIFSILSLSGGPEGIAIVDNARSDLRERAAELISATKEKLATFMKPDGSFSYTPKYSAHESQGCVAALPYTEEGDVNATNICTSGTVSLIYTCLGISNMVPIYTSADMYHFNYILAHLGHALKVDQDIHLEIDNGDNYGKGKYKENSLDFEKTTATAMVNKGILGTDKPTQLLFDNYNYSTNATIIEDRDYSNILSFKKSAQRDPYLYLYAQSTDANSYVFEADICIIDGTTSMDDKQLFSFFFADENGKIFFSASPHIYSADVYEGVQRYNVDAAKNVFIDQKVWYNYRIEIQDISTKGSEVRIYINDTLVQKRLTTATSDALARMQIRIRLKSSLSQILMDNVYFSAVKDLPKDDTVIIPPVNIEEIVGAGAIDATKRGTGTKKDSAVQYTDTNATLLSIDKKLGTSGLTYDPSDISGMAYAKIVGIKGDAALDYGKTTGTGDPWLYILPTEKRSGSSYIFETDFALMSGSEWRPDDNNLFSFYLAQNASDSIFWGGASGSIRVVDGAYSLAFAGTDAEGNSYEGALEASKWYNLRIEIEGLASGSLVKYYLNGELVHSAANTRAASGASHMLLRFNLNTTGKMYLDNTYFAATGDILPDEPEQEEPKVELPAIPGPTYVRGSGSYASNENTLTYTDTTATALGEAGKLVANNGATLDGENIFIKVAAAAGDNALVLGNNQYIPQGYLNIKASTSGTKYVFETDMMLDSSVIANSSARDGGALYEILAGSSADATAWFWTRPVICINDGVISIEIGTAKYQVAAGTWFNLRVEFENVSVSGSAVKYYLNGELINTLATTKSCTALSYIRIWLPTKALGTLSLDNTFFGALDAGEEGDEGGSGDEVVITPPDPADTVQNSANILSTATGADGIVVLMHDDASSTMYIMDEVLRELGLRGNIAMYPNGAIYTDGVLDASKIATWQRYLDTGRWQLSSHSMTHNFPGLDDSAGLITKEIITSQSVLREAFPSQRVLTYAYPGYWSEKATYGDDRFSAVMKEMVGNYYIAGRDSYGNANISLSDKNVDWKFSPSYQFSGSNVDEILSAIEKTQNGEMAVLFTHMLAANNDTLSSNQMYEKDLRTICEAVARLQNDGKVWVAFYEDAVLYTREAHAATVTAVSAENTITLTLTHTLDQNIYNYPLTVRALTPDTWEAVKITQGESVSYALVKTVAGKTCIDASVIPNADDAVITPVAIADIPADSTDNSASVNRGTGDYKDGSLGFTDTTAGDLIESGELGADSAVNVDAFAAGIMVAPEGDDNALKLGNAYGKAGYIYLNSLTNSGKHYVLEADLKLDRASSSRTDKIAFQLWGSTTKSSNTAYFGIGASITVEDGKLYFVASVNNGEGNTTKIELTPEVWYNVRIDIADVTTGGDVKYYLNGTLVHTGTTDKKTSSLASMVIWMPDKTSGILHLDNVYFGALDPVADEPEQPGDTPATAGRGNGAYADNDNTLTYTDTTATALGEAGKLITSGTGTLDGATMSASVELVDGDSALKLSNNAYNSEAYFNIQADALGSKYVFETDIMFTGAGSGRSDNNYEFLAFYSSNSQAASIATHWNGMPQARLCVVSNSDSTTTYSLMCGDKQVSLNEGEWFNIRYEFKNMSTTGNEIRVYVNGELLYTGSNTKTTSALRFIRVHIPAKTQGSIYLDNTYYSAITAE
ncbi:MAG: hypothetical protein E7676_03510 [Ruminococcaceae bacterium]|nr:hypothetical protein [Oscillospiraceae bacterium]